MATLGSRGEKLAARALRRAGYQIVARNYLCPAGEIDIIAIDGDTVVFVEVKTRVSDEAAHPSVNVTFRKQQQITRVAGYFLMSKSLQDRPCRFDVVTVVAPEARTPAIEHFINAFEPAPRRFR